MPTIERSRLRALEKEQVLNIATKQIAAGNIGRWPRVRRMWTDVNMKKRINYEPINHHRD